MGVIVSGDLPSASTHHIYSQNSYILPEKACTNSFKELRNFIISELLAFFLAVQHGSQWRIIKCAIS